MPVPPLAREPLPVAPEVDDDPTVATLRLHKPGGLSAHDRRTTIESVEHD